MSLRDAKGKTIPAWVRYIETIAASGSHTGYKASGGNVYIGFGIYCSEDAVVTFTPIDNSADITMTLVAGYHPIAVATVTTTDVAIQALFGYDPTV